MDIGSNEKYVIYPYLPVREENSQNNDYLENENNYKNAFAAPGHMFPMLEIGINYKLSSHLLGAGYSSLSEFVGISRWYEIGRRNVSIQNQRYYYQYSHIIFNKCFDNYSKSAIYPYIGGQLMLNYKESSMSVNSNSPHDFQLVNLNYRDSSILFETQFLVGFRTNHNRIFFDAGICLNLIAKGIVKSNIYEPYGSYSYYNEYYLNKNIYIDDLWKEHLFYDNIYIKIGYRF